jgi:ankyrin repeat protein
MIEWPPFPTPDDRTGFLNDETTHHHKGRPMAMKSEDELACFHALVKGDAATVEALLEKHPALIEYQDLDSLGKPDTTWLHLNTRHLAGGDREKARAVFDVLMRLDPVVNIGDRTGWTPFMYACLNGELGMANELLRRGADPFAVNDEGVNALMAAAWNGHIDCIRLTLDLGLPINGQDNKGRTALFYAGLFDVIRPKEVSLTAIRFLIEQGADHRIRNTEGKLAADSAYPKEVGEAYNTIAEDVAAGRIRDAAVLEGGLPGGLPVRKPLTFRR